MRVPLDNYFYNTRCACEFAEVQAVFWEVARTALVKLFDNFEKLTQKPLQGSSKHFELNFLASFTTKT